MKKKYFFLFICVFYLFFTNLALADSKEKIINYLKDINNFSSKFIQSENGSLSEGYFHLKNKRLKVDYEKPSQIVIIVAKNKAMYFNKDLGEVEYFNPNKTIAIVFYDVFYNQSFFDNANYYNENTFSVLKKNITINDIEYSIKIFFENTPLIIRKVVIDSEDGEMKFGILDINYNPSFKKNFFSMADPLIN